MSNTYAETDPWLSLPRPVHVQFNVCVCIRAHTHSHVHVTLHTRACVLGMAGLYNISWSALHAQSLLTSTQTLSQSRLSWSHSCRLSHAWRELCDRSCALGLWARALSYAHTSMILCSQCPFIEYPSARCQRTRPRLSGRCILVVQVPVNFRASWYGLAFLV